MRTTNILFTSYRDFRVYHVFRRDDAEDVILEFWYSLERWIGGRSFDVRGLESARQDRARVEAGDPEAHILAIRRAIDGGEIR